MISGTFSQLPVAAVIAVHNSVKVEFLWYNVVGLLGVLVVGFATSLFVKRR